MKRAQTTWQIWSWPLAFSVFTVVGLFSALLGEGGLWWAICWIALSAPLIAIASFGLRAKSTKGEDTHARSA
jgi:hypothetical protein